MQGIWYGFDTTHLPDYHCEACRGTFSTGMFYTFVQLLQDGVGRSDSLAKSSNMDIGAKLERGHGDVRCLVPVAFTMVS